MGFFAVSIHASVKDATGNVRSCVIEDDVSIHASVKDATNGAQLQCDKYNSFNPRICKRCDRCSLLCSFLPFSFNPRICKRCDYWQPIIERYQRVSIHASVKDATGTDIRQITIFQRVSIHASVKDATISAYSPISIIFRFNPRICKRCDWQRVQVRTHSRGFNPRICKRCDSGNLLQCSRQLFQSTHL